MTSAVKSLAILLFGQMALALFPGCHRSGTLQEVQITGQTQGTYYAITYLDSLGRDFSSRIDSLLTAVDQSVSIYDEHSVISRLNRNETDMVDSIFAENLGVATLVSEASDGAFDCTIGRLIEAWGWGFSKRDAMTPALIDSLKAISGYQRVRIEKGRLIKDDPNITLNFNAIAQGFTSDLIAGFLRSQGITRFLVDVGGELVANGKKPGDALWTIGIELPSEDNNIPVDLRDRPIRAILSITGKGVATSGNYRKFYVEDGVKYSHTIDPATGYPVRHTLLSATVVAGNAILADAWATAFMVMGFEKSIEILKKHPELEAYFIYSDKQGIDRTWISPGLKAYIQEIPSGKVKSKKAKG